MRKYSFLILTCCFFGGCCPPVSEKQPQFSLKENWKSPEQVDKAANIKPLDTWWEIFQDTTLNGLIEEGLENSPTVQIALARLEEAIAIAEAEWANQFPTLWAQSTASRRRIPSDFRSTITTTTTAAPTPLSPVYPSIYDPIPIPPVPTPVPTTKSPKYANNLIANLLVDYEVDFWGKYWMIGQAAYFRSIAIKEDYETAKLVLADQVASAYFSLQADIQNLTIIREQIATISERIHLQQSSYTAGVTSNFLVLDDMARLETIKAEEQSLIQSQATNTILLATLIGKEPSTLTIIPSDTNWTYPVVPAGLPSQLLYRRPDIKAAECEVDALIKEIGIAKADLLPTLDITLGTGYQAQKANRLFKWKNRLWSAQGSFNWLIFDTGRRLDEIDAAKARYKQGVARLTEALLNSIKEVENALQAITTQQNQVQIMQKRLQDLATSEKLRYSLFQAGVDPFQNVLTAKEDRLEVSKELLRESINLQLATLSLVKALGGSWGNDALPQ